MNRKIEAAVLLSSLVVVACGGGNGNEDVQTTPDAATENVCTPDCSVTWCGGDDGCGGKCTVCPANSTCNQVSWVCDCLGLWCGGNCCLPQQTCGPDNTCQGQGCLPECGGKWCGADNGCGGKCTACPDNATCNQDTWFCDCPTGWCGGACCAVGQKCGVDQTCETCNPACAGKTCGNNGCFGICGTCNAGDTCSNGNCVTCTCDNKECGEDGCGSDCGSPCSGGKTCVEGKCATHCDSEGFNGPVINSSWKPMEGADSAKGNFVFSSDTTDSYPYSGMLLVIRQYSTYKGPTGPGVYEINDDDFANCDICLVMFENCSTSECERVYLAQEGTIDISQMDGASGPFKATLNDVVLKEAVIGSDFSTQIVNNGKQWCLDDHEFSSAEVTLDIPQPFCVPEGTGTTLDKNIADFSLKNCNGQMVSLHSFCEKTKAVWIIMVTGWCPYCADLVEVAVDVLDDVAPAVEVWVVLGEDDYGTAPDQTECTAYANKHNFPRNRTFYDTGWGVLASNITPQYMSGVPYSMILDGDNMAYTWSSAFSGSLNQVLNQLLND